jgi:hypothetical protein
MTTNKILTEPHLMTQSISAIAAMIKGNQGINNLGPIPSSYKLVDRAKHVHDLTNAMLSSASSGCPLILGVDCEGLTKGHPMSII